MERPAERKSADGARLGTSKKPKQVKVSGRISPTMSEPLLPSEKRPKINQTRAMSYPFSQREILSDAMMENELEHQDVLGTLRAASERLDFAELTSSAMAGGELRASIFQRTREVELTVPTVGPTWEQASVTIATTLIGAGVLGLPYAMRRAGWVGFVLMLVSTVAASLTAKQLVWSCTSAGPGTRVFRCRFR